MSSVEEIEKAIEQLPPAQFREVARWVRELEQRQWDDQMDRDSEGGKLDFLFEEAEAEAKRGDLREWPPAT